ncbi:MAG: ArnT family glycosyltransferase [Gemmatimonadales bacterium]
MSDDRPAERWAAAGWPAAAGLVMGLALVQWIVGSRIPLDPDESYYWEWSRHLAPSYYDHPPAIAYLIRAGTSLFGDTPFGVRAFPLLANLGGGLMLLLLARRLAGAQGARGARNTALLLLALPMLSLWPLLATPDCPLFLADALALYACVRAIEAPPRSAAALGWWLAAGVGLGLGLASKLLAILLPFGILLALLSRPDLRRRLAEPGPYLACLLAVLIDGPIVAAGGSAAVFQLHHGFGRSHGAPLYRELEFVAGQVGMAGGILFVLLAVATVQSLRRSAEPRRYLLAVVALSTFAVFAVSSLRHRVEANWPLPAYLPAVVLLATVQGDGRWRRWLRAGVALGGGLVILGYLQMVTPVLPFHEELIRRGHGWDEVALRVALHRESPRTWVAGNTYQDASKLAFHLPDHPRVFALNLRSRDNQYSAWPGFPDLARRGDDLVFLLGDRRDPPAAVSDLSPHFARVRVVDSIAPTAEHPEAPTRRVWLLEDWQGSWPDER